MHQAHGVGRQLNAAHIEVSESIETARGLAPLIVYVQPHALAQGAQDTVEHHVLGLVPHPQLYACTSAAAPRAKRKKHGATDICSQACYSGRQARKVPTTRACNQQQQRA